MASILKVDTLTGVTTAGSIAVTGEGNSTTTNLQQGLAKHWVKLDASSGTPTARDSLNNSSLTDTAQARIGINFSSSFGNDDYAMTGTGSNNYTNTQSKDIVKNSDQTDTSSLSNVMTKYGGQGDGEDRDDVSVVHHGDLA